MLYRTLNLELSFIRQFILQLVLIVVLPTLGFTQDRNRSLEFSIPMLILNSDARAGGMGDTGVATTPDVFSQYWNPAKYIFSLENSGVGLNYSSYLSKLTNDVFLAKMVYFRKQNESVWGVSFNYFNIGEVELTQDYGSSYISEGFIVPNELSIDISYSLLLSERFSMGVLGQWLHSNLQRTTDEKYVSNSVAVGIFGYYQSRIRKNRDKYAQWRAGFNISNIGPKISYNGEGQEYFIPTNLKIGASYALTFQSLHTLLFSLELNKLLIPTPPVYGYVDKNGNGIKDKDEPRQIIRGKDSNVSFLKGIAQSFSDAPGGFTEELQEITWAFGIEYNYANTLFLRGGYFYEHKYKGGRNYATMGVGIKLKAIDFNLAYALSVANYAIPLQNNIRLSLAYDF